LRIRLTNDQVDALDNVLGCVYDNERDKGPDGLGLELLESIEHCHLLLSQSPYFADSTDPLWIYDASDNPTDGRIIPGNGYAFSTDGTHIGGFATIKVAFNAWCRHVGVDSKDFFVQIEDHDPIFKIWDIPFSTAGLIEHFIDCYGDLTYYVDDAETEERNAETVLAPVRTQLLWPDRVPVQRILSALRSAATHYERTSARYDEVEDDPGTQDEYNELVSVINDIEENA